MRQDCFSIGRPGPREAALPPGATLFRIVHLLLYGLHTTTITHSLGLKKLVEEAAKVAVGFPDGTGAG